MAEYIEREAAIEKTEAFCDVFVTKWTDEKVIAWIRKLPAADVVEVVRCKDCKSCLKQTAFSVVRDGVHIRLCHCDELGRLVRDDDFCSYGERKDGE